MQSTRSFHFQGEIGIFFPLIVLRSLDGTDFPVNQKISVLKYDSLMLINIYHVYVVQSNYSVLFWELHLSISFFSFCFQNA